jgi:hypothetical protein
MSILNCHAGKMMIPARSIVLFLMNYAHFCLKAKADVEAAHVLFDKALEVSASCVYKSIRIFNIFHMYVYVYACICYVYLYLKVTSCSLTTIFNMFVLVCCQHAV